MLDYDNDSRRLLAREHAERLAHEMRRTRRITPDVAGFPGRTRLGELLRRVTRLNRAKAPESSIPAYEG
jgi:hypothetical protein